jgi:hypothetical protein
MIFSGGSFVSNVQPKYAYHECLRITPFLAVAVLLIKAWLKGIKGFRIFLMYNRITLIATEDLPVLYRI